MWGSTEHLTNGERVAWYRRRRGLSQEVLAGLVGRTGDWLSKVENGHIPLDRLSVLRRLADALGVSLGDLIGEPSVACDATDGDTTPMSALRALLMDYRPLTPILSGPDLDAEPSSLAELEHELQLVFDAYQASRFSIAASRLPLLLMDTILAARNCDHDKRCRAHELLALTYQATAAVLTKLGDSGLALVAAERGLTAAQSGGECAVVGSLIRAVAFALLSAGRNEPARQLSEAGASYLRPYLVNGDGNLWSVYGTLFLVASMAAARSGDRASTAGCLHEAEVAAQRLRGDGNHLWTAFGPTNVKIHRINTAMELGDVQIALDLGPGLDTSAVPIERRVRHLLDVARAYNASGRQDSAFGTVLAAERLAPDQIANHYVSRRLVCTWIRHGHGEPHIELVRLADRMGIARTSRRG